LPAGHGTVLYFDETAVTARAGGPVPNSYRDNFPVWAQQANGMLQFAVWTALEQEGLGASLQHYNPLIDDEVKKAFSLPDSWQLIAEMPFGAPAGKPGDKAVQPAEERMRVSAPAAGRAAGALHPFQPGISPPLRDKA
jgi:predicted oxidoreductase (fatty acid repression mutant protein)